MCLSYSLQNGQILAWKVSSESETTTNPFQPAHVLEGHTQGIVCLTIGRNMLYSGSFDGTIKVKLVFQSFVDWYSTLTPVANFL